eukprot:g3667.t1
MLVVLLVVLLACLANPRTALANGGGGGGVCNIPSEGFYELTENCNLAAEIVVESRKTLTIVGVGAPTIDRGGSGRHFTVRGALTLHGAIVLINGGNVSQGGAVRVVGVNATLKCTRCEFARNAAQGLGGAIYVADSPSANVACEACSFSNNSAKFAGGGIFVGKDSRASLLGHTKFIGNKADVGNSISNGGGKLRLTCLAGQYLSRSIRSGGLLEVDFEGCPSLCPRGRFAAEDGVDSRELEECLNCPKSTFCEREGMSEPRLCPAGRYGEEEEVKSVTCSGPCQPGHFCPKGSTNATARPCPAGRFTGKTGQRRERDCNISEPGFYSERAASSARACPKGVFGNTSGYGGRACAKCAPTKSNLASGSRQCVGKRCKRSEYLNNSNSDFKLWECTACPDGADCDAAEDVTWPFVVAREGYFRLPGPEPQRFAKCRVKSACPGDLLGEENVTESSMQLCSTGHRGLLCGRCMAGWESSGQGVCLPCDSLATFKISMGFVGIIILWVYFVQSSLRNDKKTLEIEMAKISLSGAQALSVLGRYPLQWPPAVASALDALSSAFTVAGDVVSFRCYMDPEEGSRYLRGSAILIALPLVLCISSTVFWCLKGLLQGVHWKTTRSNCVVSVMVLTFMALPSLNKVTFQLFSCLEIAPGLVRLSSDPDIPCFGRTHLVYIFSVGLPSLMIYIVGVPVVAVVILRRMDVRDKLFKSREESYTASVYEFLYGGFRRSMYFWEAVILLRKVLLNVILVTMQETSPISQALAVQLMLFASVSLHFVFRPYEEDVLNNIELWSLALSCCTLYVGLFLFDSGGSDAMKQILSVLIVSMYLVSAAAFLIGLCIFAKKSRKTEWEAAVKSEPYPAAWLLQLPDDRGRRLIDARDGNGRLLLMLAVAHGRAEIATLLLKHGAKIDSRDMLGRTAVAHGASKRGQRLVQTRLAKFEKRHGYAKALHPRVEMKQEDRRQFTLLIALSLKIDWVLFGVVANAPQIEKGRVLDLEKMLQVVVMILLVMVAKAEGTGCDVRSVDRAMITITGDCIVNEVKNEIVVQEGSLLKVTGNSGVCIKCSEGKTTASNGSRVCIGKECKPGLEYLMMQDAKWDCADCPEGGVCARDAKAKDILVRAGYYRAEGITFLPCQVKEACVGADTDDDREVAKTSNASALEGCNGDRGYMDSVLCSRCRDGFAKTAGGECRPCIHATVTFCIGIIGATIMVIYIYVRVKSAMRRNRGGGSEH